MEHLLIDFVNPQGNRALVTRLDKIDRNIRLIPGLKDSVDGRKKNKTGAFSSMTVFGRWIVVYQGDVTDESETIMHFMDFRMDYSDADNLTIFSPNTLHNIIQLQQRYDKVFTPKHDTVELTFAEPFERVSKPNLFTCDIDSEVIKRAKALGVLPMLETMTGADKLKVVLADEKVKDEDRTIINVYALIHFGDYHNNDADNGFGYLKIHDLARNADRIADMEAAIQGMGGSFNRAYLMQRFDEAKLN